MAKSKAQKQRAHAIRQGRLDPRIKRGLNDIMSTRERKLPTKQERQNRSENKYKQQLLAF